MRKPALLLCACTLLVVGTAAQHRTPALPRNSVVCGPLKDQTFRCPKFGFTYKVVFGWVERTKEMQASGAGQEPVPNEPATGRTQPSEAKGKAPEILLAVFERPPQAQGQTINSAVVIATEPRAYYPAVKTAAGYFGPITDLAAQRGLQPVSDPYVFAVGGKQLLRGDFSGKRVTLTMFQSSLVTIRNGEIISFTFIAGSEDEVEELIANLSFGISTRPQQHPAR